MLQRRCENGLVFYASEKFERLGIRHAFSTRIGGISPAPFDSLNLGNPNGARVQDDYARIWANYAKLTKTIGCSGEPPLRVHQIHGADVVSARANQAFNTDCKADALVSDDPHRVISIRTADCTPILLATPDSKIVAAVHAGWRGIIAGVIPAAVARMIELQPDLAPSDFLAAVGPCIGPAAFEVGPEVLAEFESAFGPEAPISRKSDGKGTVDLPSAARRQLIAAGLRDHNIDGTDRCTYTHGKEFFSHRRDRGITGRMAAVIAANST
jgi:hypothetical protein